MADQTNGSEKPRRRVWVQDVAVGVRSVQTRLDVAAARGLAPDEDAIWKGVSELLASARRGAFRQDPIPRSLANWWRGTLVEAAYLNLHAAKAQIVDLYNDEEVAAEVPVATSRARAAMLRDDLRLVVPAEFERKSPAERRTVLRRLIEEGYDGLDHQHARLRSFRNIVLMAAVTVALLVAATIVAVSLNPTVMPLCFPDPDDSTLFNCPTRSLVPPPAASGGDILIVALLGLLGGALAATVAIRKIRGTSTPYDLAVALAWLKGPLGAFTAIIGLVAIRGEFVPGLSSLDSQEQILAYALVLGVGQQAFTRLLDNRAQDLLTSLPAKDTPSAPASGDAPRPVSAGPPQVADAGGDGGDGSSDQQATGMEAPELPSPIPAPAPPAAAGNIAPAAVADDPNDPQPEPETLPNPGGDDDDQVQDDDSVVLPDAPAADNR